MSENDYHDQNRLSVVAITHSTLINNFVSICLNGIFFGYFSKYYFEMDTDLNNKFSSYILFALLIHGYCVTFNNVLKLLLNSRIIGTIMLKYEHDNYLMLNSSIYKIIFKLTQTAAYICAMILVPIFIPFNSEHCDDYSKGLCFFGRWNAFFGIIGMIVLGIFIIPYLITIVGKCCCVCGETDSHSFTSSNTIQRVQNMVISNSILSEFIDTTSVCSICITDASDGNNTFVKLQCGHKLHKTCLMEFMSSNLIKNCPECRQPINSTGVINLHVNTDNDTNASNPVRSYEDNCV
jgi:hypothetical protein